jgi:hypothetical protein
MMRGHETDNTQGHPNFVLFPRADGMCIELLDSNDKTLLRSTDVLLNTSLRDRLG